MLIACHGSPAHIASSFNTKIIDIFDKKNEKLTFSEDILFPTEHLKILLENAKKNIKVYEINNLDDVDISNILDRIYK